MTPSEHANETSIEYGKVTPLEVGHLDEAQIHEDTPKLDAEHVALLKPKRLSRIRHTRYKAQVYEHGLALDIQENAQVHDHSLTLDEEDGIQYTNAPEDTLTPEDSLTRLYALEEARGLDQEVKYHRPYSNEQRYGAYSKNPHSLS